ncbi:MAG TPA: hypothetical protein VHT24_10190 [Pseudacidobacterium sp.]|jgi:hypothetical protein|nr:hypothetical protein [Pseudacidobacterium sp.]
MQAKRLFRVIAGLVLTSCLSATGQEAGYWRATSSTAQSITGDVFFSEGKLVINFSPFPIVLARDLPPAEVSAVFDADSNTNAKGHLYKLDIPATKKFLHKNTLCGSGDAQWLVAYVDGRTLNLAFFSSQKPPVFTLDAIQNSTDLCGIFSYAR